jgi:cytochrome c oxidase subunit 2
MFLILLSQTRRLSAKSTLLSWMGVLLLACGATSYAADGAKLYAPCAACHGARAEGNPALNSPALAGQDAAYLARQLRSFRAGQRGTHRSDSFGPQMRAAAATLPDEAAIASVAAWIGALPKTHAATAAKGDLRNGNNLYHGRCGACHGGKAEGIPALNAPRLTGLDSSYIKRQFRYFRDGVRGTEQKDLPGRQMAMMAKTMPAPRDLDDVIAFIHQLGRAK